MTRVRGSYDVSNTRRNRWTPSLFTICFIIGATTSFVYGYGIGAPGQYEFFYNQFIKKSFDFSVKPFTTQSSMLYIMDSEKAYSKLVYGSSRKEMIITEYNFSSVFNSSIFESEDFHHLKTFIQSINSSEYISNKNNSNSHHENTAAELYDQIVLKENLSQIIRSSSNTSIIHVNADGLLPNQVFNVNKTLQKLCAKYSCQTMTKREVEKMRIELLNQIMNGIGQTMFILGCLIGAFTCPYISKIRKDANLKMEFLVCYGAAIVSGLVTIVSFYMSAAWLFLLARIFHGYSSGISCVIVPSFLTNISPVSIRGETGSFHQIFLAIGILIGQILGLPVIFGTACLWHFGMAAVGITPLLGIIAMPFVFRKVSSWSMEKEIFDTDMSESASTGILQLLKNKKLTWQIITSSLLLELQALCGINAIFFYAFEIFKRVGIEMRFLPYATLLTGVTEVTALLFVMKLVDKLGRRPLIFMTTAAEICIFIVMTLLIKINEKANSVQIAWVCVALVLVFIFLFCCGLGPVPFIYGAEVFRSEYRVAGMGVAMCINYVCNLFLTLFFPLLHSIIKAYVFAFFALIICANVTILYFKMPETKNEPIEKIEQFWIR